MFCSIHKWLISRSMDTGKSLPRMVKRHIRTCASCRRFAQLSDGLAESFSKAEKKLQRREALEQRIISGLDISSPEEKRPAFRFRLFPAWAAGILLAAVFVLYISSAGPFSMNRPSRPQAVLELSEASVPRLMEGMVSPIHREADVLTQNLRAAAESLLDTMRVELVKPGNSKI